MDTFVKGGEVCLWNVYIHILLHEMLFLLIIAYNMLKFNTSQTVVNEYNKHELWCRIVLQDAYKIQ